MAKFVAKVAGITLFIIVSIFTLVWLVMALFCPKPMCKIYKSIGDYDMAMHYAAVSYKRTQTMEDLIEVANISIRNDNDTFVLNYTQKLITNREFETYCKNMENGMEYYDLIVSEYITRMYDTNRYYISWMVDEAFDYTDDYRSGSAIRSFLVSAIEKEDILAIEEFINVANRCKSNFSGESLELCLLDIENMKEFVEILKIKKLATAADMTVEEYKQSLINS